MFEAAIRRAHKKALKLGIIQGKKEGLREGRQETIASFLKQGVISQGQAGKALKGLL